MRALSILAIALGALILAAPAWAQDVSYVAHDTTVGIQPPDGWRVENTPGQPLNIVSTDYSVAITTSIVVVNTPPDELAAYIMSQLQADPDQKEPAALTISGHDASAYRSAMIDKSGRHKNLRFITLRLDSGAVLLCMVMTQDNLTAAQQSAADAAVSTLTIAPGD